MCDVASYTICTCVACPHLVSDHNGNAAGPSKQLERVELASTRTSKQLGLPQQQRTDLVCMRQCGAQVAAGVLPRHPRGGQVEQAVFVAEPRTVQDGRALPLDSLQAAACAPRDRRKWFH